MFWYDWTYMLVIPGLILGIWAQCKVKSAYAKYSRVPTRKGRSAASVVNDALHRQGNYNVRIGVVNGELTDHYDPSRETLNLSSGVYSSDSVAALGIAAHEAGHAMQKFDGYLPLKLRTAIVPAVNFCSGLSSPLFCLGLIFSWEPLTTLGILLFAASTVFALVTLPVEFNASRRAVAMLTDGGYISGDEERGVRSVLTAAALTYVAAAVTSLLSLLRLVTIANRRRD